MADSTRRWQKVMMMLYAVSALIMIRSVFRVIEYIMGTDGYLLRKEWPLYIFDALLMLLKVGIFAWWYPGRLDVSSVAIYDNCHSGSDIGLETGQSGKNRRPEGQKSPTTNWLKNAGIHAFSVTMMVVRSRRPWSDCFRLNDSD